jgi:hypothetical protein
MESMMEAARGIEEEEDRPTLCSSQVDSLRTVLSIHGGLYTSQLFVHVWLDQQANNRYWSVRNGPCTDDAIPQSMV